MFEVALANVKSKKEMLKTLVLISTLDINKIPNMTYYRTNNFEIEFLQKPKSSWCIDGEEYKTDELKFVFDVEQSMKMLVPKENINKLFDEQNFKYVIFIYTEEEEKE